MGGPVFEIEVAVRREYLALAVGQFPINRLVRRWRPRRLLIRDTNLPSSKRIILDGDKIEQMSAAAGRYFNSRLFYYAAMTAILLVMCPWLWQGARDAYVGYSGTVVAKGNYMWVPFRGMDRYIILEDSNGHRTRRYVGAVGYAYCDIGSYVVKKRGLGEFPREPGDLTPREFEELVRRKHERK